MAETEPLPDKLDKPAESYPATVWPIAVALVLAMVGVGFGVAGFWRRASVMIAVAMVAAGGMRLVLPRAMAGLLVVRRRTFDVVVYFALAAAITVVAFIVPPAR